MLINYKVTSRVIQKPTYTQTGQKLVTETCQYCHHQREKTQIIPKQLFLFIQISNHDDSHYRSSGGYDGGGSSGGDFGGGSSGGGGAGGSW